MKNRFKTLALASCAFAALGTAAHAQEKARFDIAGGDLKTALQTFAGQTSQEVLFSTDVVAGRRTKGVSADADPQTALLALLDGTGLTYRTTSTGTLLIVKADQGPQSGSAAGGGAEVEALIVTAQKREEDIQDVPIAISAFSQEDLTRSQVAGGPDLITQVPNMTFTKTNFSSYSIQIRGIGTQAISATTDPAVAVAFNNTPFIRNRFFEQEFYDLQRVEVLRGPQGTLYGRNATGGVVNIISQKPKFTAESKLSADLSNYNSSRIEGMVNIPLVEDRVALRLAGAWTKRNGYAANELTGNSIDGRDLWSTRLSLRVTPNDRLDANLIWEHFEEEDDRLRSGKQLCKKHVITEVAGFATPYYLMGLLSGLGQGGPLSGPQATFSQGCIRNSLYANNSFQRPNGLMLPYYMPLGAIGLPTALTDPYISVTNSTDPAVIGATNDQPEDLRVIQSTIDPRYRAKSDLGELQVSYDLSDTLTLTSETAYAVDTVYSLQDYNRFNTAPGAWRWTNSGGEPSDLVDRGILKPGGIFCDPQLGCSDRLVAVDVSTATATQFSQEFRLASDYDGPFNFSLGANYLRADSEDKYYVFINSLSLIAMSGPPFMPMPEYVPGETDNSDCLLNGYAPGNPGGVYTVSQCIYFDPNPIESVNDKGHNYFLSKNPYKLISYAVFGEAYYNITDALKVTAGLRWTVDKKDAPRVPTWILAALSYGYPVAEVIEQEWREPTGRLTVDWKPQLPFTDETLVYGSFAHGYKAGGANPPGFVRLFYASGAVDDAVNDTAKSATRPRTFDPEFVNAFELGTKNTFLDGTATLNLAAFYYDYTGYQISEIVDRSAFNRNFDAEIWGAELESDWRPLENLKFGLKLGYQKTRIADGEQAIDLMDRTAGDPRWAVVRPFPTYASSCILPAWLFVGNDTFGGNGTGNPGLVNLGGTAGGSPGGCEFAYAIGVDPVTYQPYVANPDPSVIANSHGPNGAGINYAAWSTDLNDYPGWPTGVPLGNQYPGWDPSTAPNGGEGIMKPLGGNELPNAPNWTATITADYTVPLPNEWLATLHTDLHWQAESWWRVFNDHEYNRLDEYFTMNLAAIFTNEERGWNIMAYIKNVTDETAITGAFLNSDDTGLTTNVFLTEPRLYGLRVTKAWTGGPLLGSFGANREGPFPLTVELGGQVQRHDAPNTALHPAAADVFTGPLDIFDDAQAQDLDWGDGREVTVTWRPGDLWSVSAAARFGKTNGLANPGEQWRTPSVCAVVDPDYCAFFATDPKYQPFLIHDASAINRADARVYDREEHTLVDFSVGRDFGFGGLKDSRISGGVRFARLKSNTDAHLYGIPDWDLPAGFYYQPSVTHTLVNVDTSARREFEGFGPVLTWDAALPLLEFGDHGHLAADWSVAGGLLFGEQQADISTKVKTRYYEIAPIDFLIAYSQTGERTVLPALIVDEPSVITSRSEGATVPLFGARLGLSYQVGGFSIGGGYRWERYFDAVDGGYTDKETVDRTIDGPYFKIAVGFGG
jgi:outer membrane receptor protein involved in Fe transport